MGIEKLWYSVIMRAIGDRKVCSECRENLPLGGFHKSRATSDGLNHYCKKCAVQNWYRYRLRRRHVVYATVKRYRDRLRRKVLIGYGHECKCCGIREAAFLTIDHVNNDGALERRGKKKSWRAGNTTFYLHIINSGFPDRYQLLCWNCNTAKYRCPNGCPHKSIQTHDENQSSRDIGRG